MKKKKVLILVDLQHDFVDGSLANPDAQACMPAILNKIKHFDGDAIFLTMDSHYNDYLNTPEGQKLPVKHCIYDTHGWTVMESVRDAVEAKECLGTYVRYIEKPTFGSVERTIACKTTLVEEILNLEKGSDEPIPMEIEICGFISDICVLHNAIILKAFTYDFAEITVDSKCCAGSTPENHQKAMDLMKIGQINII